MASVRIQRSIRIKRLVAAVGTVSSLDRETAVQIALDEIDKDLHEAFELGRKYPQPNIPSAQPVHEGRDA